MISSGGDSQLFSPRKRQATGDDSLENIGNRSEKPTGDDCYRLVGFVSHIGNSSENGHYVADVFRYGIFDFYVHHVTAGITKCGLKRDPRVFLHLREAILVSWIL